MMCTNHTSCMKIMFFSKVTILLFVFFELFYVDAVVFTSSINKKAKKSTKLINRSKFVSESNNLHDTSDVNYYMTIYVGTPPQTFNVAFQINANFTWIVDSSYALIPCVNPGGSVFSLSKYNSTDSSTYVALSPQTPFQTNETIVPVAGFLGSDTVCVGLNPPLCATNQIFGQTTSAANNAFLVEGFLVGTVGLQPSYANDSTQSVLTNILPQLDSPLFTVHLKSKGVVFFNDDGGSITFGAIDTQNCSASIQYAPITSVYSQFYWAVAVEGISIGSQNFLKSSLAILDPFNSYIYGPSAWLSGAVASLNATLLTNSALGNIYTLPCNGSYPDLVISMPTTTNASATLHIPSSIYVANANMTDPNICYLLLADVVNFTPTDNYSWGFGAPLFRAFCGIFDVGNQRVGFATNLG